MNFWVLDIFSALFIIVIADKCSNNFNFAEIESPSYKIA